MSGNTESLTSLSASSCECPICFVRLHLSKQLDCGHTICEKCSDKLHVIGTGVRCPICQCVTKKTPNELPRNFALQDVIEREDESMAKKFSCISCKRKTNNDDFFTCATCAVDVCLKCIITSHEGHAKKEIDNFLKKKEAEFVDFRNPIIDSLTAVKNRSKVIAEKKNKIAVELSNLEDAILLKNTEFMEGLTRLDEKIHGTTVSQFISEQHGHFENTLQQAKAELSIYEKNQTAMDDVLSSILKNIDNHYAKIKSQLTFRGEMSTRTTFQRTAKGYVTIAECDLDGKFIVLENSHRSKEEKVGEWKLKRKIDGMKEVVYTFPTNVVIKPGKTTKVWAREQGGYNNPPSDLVFDGETNWGTGNTVQTSLVNKDEEERATHTQRTVQQGQ